MRNSAQSKDRFDHIEIGDSVTAVFPFDERDPARPFHRPFGGRVTAKAVERMPDGWRLDIKGRTAIVTRDNFHSLRKRPGSVVNDLDDRRECQVCARMIKAPGGIIAHHGFERPGNGMIYNTCPGARHVPYDEGREAIPPVVEHMNAQRDSLKKALRQAETGASPIPPIRLGGRAVEPGSATFAAKQRECVGYLKSEISLLATQIRMLRKRYDSWPGANPRGTH